VRVRVIENSQSVFLSETDFLKCAHQGSHVCWGEFRFRARPECSQVHHSLIDSPLAASTGQLGKGVFARSKIKVALRSQTNEFMCADDLKLEWHNQDGF